MKKTAFLWLLLPVLLAALLFGFDQLKPQVTPTPPSLQYQFSTMVPPRICTFIASTCADDTYFLSYPAKCLNNYGTLVEVPKPVRLRWIPLGTPTP